MSHWSHPHWLFPQVLGGGECFILLCVLRFMSQTLLIFKERVKKGVVIIAHFVDMFTVSISWQNISDLRTWFPLCWIILCRIVGMFFRSALKRCKMSLIWALTFNFLLRSEPSLCQFRSFGCLTVRVQTKRNSEFDWTCAVLAPRLWNSLPVRISSSGTVGFLNPIFIESLSWPVIAFYCLQVSAPSCLPILWYCILNRVLLKL